jgi:endonuclease/exonuclease/phosphatase family metal-dependent hydrolase
MSRFLNCRTIYEPNAILDHGHHGNAILTGLEILRSFRRDVSTNRFERRGLLYTHLKWGLEPIHVVNVHLGLNRWQRRFQVKEISWLLKQVTEDGQPLILGGDFNDWTGRLHPLVQKLCGVQSALEAVGNGSRRSFPSTFPLFSLDRIYFRGLKLVRARVLTEKSWQKLSDHLPIEAEFESLHPRR